MATGSPDRLSGADRAAVLAASQLGRSPVSLDNAQRRFLVAGGGPARRPASQGFPIQVAATPDAGAPRIIRQDIQQASPGADAGSPNEPAAAASRRGDLFRRIAEGVRRGRRRDPIPRDDQAADRARRAPRPPGEPPHHGRPDAARDGESEEPKWQRIAEENISTKPVMVRFGPDADPFLVIADDVERAKEAERNAGIHLFTPDGAKVVHRSTAARRTIGRESDNDIVILGGTISRHHATMQRTSAGWMLGDMASRNGTFTREIPRISVGETDVPVPAGTWRHITASRGVTLHLGQSTIQLTEALGRSFVQEEDILTELPLNTPINFGRIPSNGIHRAEADVSREHGTLIALQDGGYLVRDKGSHNGTRVSVMAEEQMLPDPYGPIGADVIAEMRHRAETYLPPAEQVAALGIHVAEGVELIKEGDPHAVIAHFTPGDHTEHLGINYIAPGDVRYIHQLLTEEDVVNYAGAVASKSRPNELPEYLPAGGTFEDPALFNPALVERFQYEMALIFAEEWLHRLQDATRAPIAGQENGEVDIAAYFEEHGIAMSLDFITRYADRANWFIDKHPEREQEIRAFQQKYKR